MSRLVASLIIMALTTYFLRSLPLTLFTKQIKNPFVRSFLAYVPYAVLAAMTIPDIFFSTATLWSAVAGLAVAVVLSLVGCGLLPVALGACLTAFVAEWLI